MSDYTKAELQEVAEVWDNVLLGFDEKRKRHYLGLTVPHHAAPRVMLTVRRIVESVVVPVEETTRYDPTPPENHEHDWVPSVDGLAKAATGIKICLICGKQGVETP